MADSLFIIDSDALIHAYRYDFPPNGNHGGFWQWLDKLAQSIDIIVPESVRNEIREGNDGLADLLATLPSLKSCPTSDSLPNLPNVLYAYGTLTEIDLEIIGKTADPYVISHAVSLHATVVSNETSEPRRTAPRNKKIPDICDCLHVSWMRYPHFIWEMRGVSVSIT